MDLSDVLAVDCLTLLLASQTLLGALGLAHLTVSLWCAGL